MRNAAVLFGLLLSGCHGAVGYQWGAMPGAATQTAAVDMRVGVSSDGVLGAILIGILVADGIRYYWRLPDGPRRPYYGTPEADPARLINVQDCTRPINPTAGNLMCQ